MRVYLYDDEPSSDESKLVVPELDSFGYTEPTRSLEVRFKEGGRYRYYGVPPTVYKMITNASSASEAFHRLVKDRYASELVEKEFG